ncbi:MAG: hypothetical protein E6J02_02115 [Chloroflexi bacterium]|nr:MAG: hypothetical protein E6J02_02115 [Chloroflexota bacterium]TME19168.1 MAG: hypothetical protein E6I63_00580 [Chloroflexota bacterium]
MIEDQGQRLTIEDEKRKLLDRVASGDVSPEEGRRILDDLVSDASGDVPLERRRVRQVRVVRTTANAEIVGDAAIREVIAVGADASRRDGDTLVIDGFHGNGDGDGDGDGARLRLHRRDHRLSRADNGESLRVRMNPNLPLEVEGRAGSVRVRDVMGPIRCAALAGSTSIEGFVGPLNVSLNAGSIRLRGRLDRGHSTVSCGAGSILINLEAGSSVRVSTRSASAHVRMDGRKEGHEWVIGDGRATLVIETTTGSIRLTSDAPF